MGLAQGENPSPMQKAGQCVPAFCMSDGAELSRQEAGEHRKVGLETIVSPPHTSPDKPVPMKVLAHPRSAILDEPVTAIMMMPCRTAFIDAGAAGRFHLDMRAAQEWTLSALEENETFAFWKDLIEEEQTDGSPQTYTEQTIILRQMVRPITTTFLCSDQVATTTPDRSAPITRSPSAVIIDFENARRRVAAG